MRKGSSSVRYYLGAKYPGLYFAKREAECMYHFLRGKSIPQTGKILKISPRTVEYYLNNMKRKLKCRSKSELIEKILATDFIAYMI